MKSAGSVGGQADHVERKRQTLNADPDRLELNQRLVGSDDPKADVLERLEETEVEVRKGAVIAIDVFMTASPEHFKSNHPDDPNWKAFQERALEFLRKEYGADNVVHAVAHHDETSPHLHAIITPIRSKTIKVGRKTKTERTENRLCARDWLGGDRYTLSKLQTRFADSVKDLGLDRGIERSVAKHEDIKRVYGLGKKIQELEPIIKESNNLKSEISDLIGEKSKLSSERDNAIRQLEQFQQLIKELETTRQDTDKKIRSENQELERVNKLIDEKQRELKKLTEQKSQELSQVKQLTDARPELQKEIRSLVGDRDTLKGHVKTLLEETSKQQTNYEFVQKMANRERSKIGQVERPIEQVKTPELKTTQIKR